MLKHLLQALRGLFIRPAYAATSAALVTAAILYPLSDRSNLNLVGVHPPLVTVTQCAHDLTKGGFTVIDGMRTEEEQVKNVASGVSWILKSRHLTGHAIDFAAHKNGKITFDENYYPPVAAAFNQCSLKYGIPIIWGGEWKVRDWGHIELDRRKYP
ncbi:MAG: peptidase M15 [Micavibrio aeruginosavorus]|uniref:Peptidase M15 n=1 Tax=Micavibrio aeruginosavorus TaxID=349221 RepID=A0A2W5MY54_9BACT|nr:MAG: peptidase M15 [Micavibrio aeruginosavorus]